ncbi:hypothetical protein BT96DRAFT_1001832 [Gymnopus androsaceus JB14]|uniref:Lysine-specific metallo-endopeptidase domain-containing protein n=1 Tax=Gymnopus androsaceus JB14 TaxID=1447944 RepID=A0A6A4H0P8_9AGAR|nr:hypothetical protein BT96DRAFT_1001832 [Gymnopus androsaceus JB14]
MPSTKEDYHNKLQNALVSANLVLKALEHEIDGSEGEKRINNAFGSRVDRAAVKKCIQKLTNPRNKLEFPHGAAVDHSVNAIAATNMADPGKGITFGTFFIGNTEEDNDMRVGTIIHEATHALCGTVDWFDKHTFEPVDEVKDKTGNYHGYLDSNLKDLVRSTGIQMHRNADSYRVLAMKLEVPTV